MLSAGILNPQVIALLARVRHTNTLAIADRGFPSWGGVETVDISLVDDVPTVLDVVRAIRAQWNAGHAWMAEEFRGVNDVTTQEKFASALAGVVTYFEPHVAFKMRIPGVVGIIRTGDTTQYANIVLESA